MDLTNYTVSNEPTRLSGQLYPRGKQTGLTPGAGFLVGLIFLAAGTMIALVGLKVIHVDPKTVHVPYSVLTCIGAVFYAAGVWLWFMGYSQYKENCRRAAVQTQGSTAVAMADYPWAKTGTKDRRWDKASTQLVAVVFFTLFLSVFNWVAFFASRTPIFAKLIVAVFDVVLVYVWIQCFLAWGRAMKFGASRVEFASFPFHMGEPVVLRWITPTGINRADSGVFQLRCVQQWYEARGSRNNRLSQLIQEVVWSGTYALSKPEQFPPGKSVELRFGTPENMPATNFSKGPKVVFWELQINLKEPGLDFTESYLVPVYSRNLEVQTKAA